jgi:hypothetical protein
MVTTPSLYDSSVDFSEKNEVVWRAEDTLEQNQKFMMQHWEKSKRTFFENG